MAITADQVIVELQAKVDRYNSNVANAERRFSGAMQRIGRQARLAESAASGAFRGIAGAFASAAALRGAQQLIDASTRIENSLKVVGLAGQSLERVYESLFVSAQRNMAPLETLTTLYSRLGLAQRELGATNEQLLDFTDRVALALRVQGTTAQEARGALIQLSQAMGAGIVRAEEFNSIVEGAPSILRAASAGLVEAEGSVAKLRALVIEGRLSSQAFFQAFLAGSVILEDQVANAEVTVSQGFVRLQNVLIDVARQMNEGSRVSGVLVDGLDNLGVTIRSVAEFANYAVGPISDFISWLQTGQNAANGFANELARLSGLEGIGTAAATWINDRNIPGFTAGSSQGGRVLDSTFSLLGSTPQDEALAAILAGREPPAPVDVPVSFRGPQGRGRPVISQAAPEIDRVSLADYPITGGAGGGGGRSGRGGGGRRQSFDDIVQQQERENEMLREKTALFSTLNPLVNDLGFAEEKLRVQQELRNEAERAGLELTPDRIAAIDELAEAYAHATVEAERLQMAQDLTRDAINGLGDAGKSAMRGFIDDLVQGTSAANALSNALNAVLSSVIDIGLNMVFGGGGGLLRGLFGFSDGGYTGAGGKYQPAGVVHGGEYVFSKEAVQRAGVGNLDAMHRSLKGYANGGLVAPAMPSMGGGGGSGQPVQILLQVQEGAAFETRVLEVSGPASVEVSRQSVTGYDRNMPSTMSNYDARYR